MDLKKGYNAFIKANNAMNKIANKGIEKVTGKKDVLGELQEWEDPREYAPYDSFPKYFVDEPQQWGALTGNVHTFSLCGNTLNISAEMDLCMQYRKAFSNVAKYYKERFEFMYHNCVEDYDTLVHYFPDMYMEGLTPMLQRAYNLLVLFDIFNENIESLSKVQLEHYNAAIRSYNAMMGVEKKRNEQAAAFGNTLANSMHMEGGYGFGSTAAEAQKNAMKGALSAEVFNLKMGLVGKFVEHQTRLRPEEKEKVYSLFKEDVFFNEVYRDYANTFRSFVYILATNGKIKNITIGQTKEYLNTLQNLDNPLFPKEKIAPTLAGLISRYPFEEEWLSVLQQKLEQTEEVTQIINYFS